MHLGVAERAGDKPRTYRLKQAAETTATPPLPTPAPAGTAPSPLKQQIDQLRAKLPDPDRWAGMRLAADGGPSVTMMSNNATVRQIGHMLAGELDRRVQARMAAGPGPQDWGKVSALEDKAVAAFSTYSRQHDQAQDDAARKRGFASYAALAGAYRDAHAGTPEEARLISIMSDVNRDTDQATAQSMARWTELNDERVRVTDELADSAERTETVQREEAIKLLAEVRGDTFGGPGLTYQGRNRYTEVPSKPNPQGLAAMRFAETNYPQGWLEAARQYTGKAGVSVIYPVPRGDYTDRNKMIRLSDGPPSVKGDPGSGRVATHELGHAMELAVPGLLQLEQAEIWRRTSRGEIGHRLIDTPKLMHGYTGESARADRFPQAYSGKDYSNGSLGADAYELFTTGAESLFTGGQYLDGPFKAWMLGVMATLGRDAPPAGQ